MVNAPTWQLADSHRRRAPRRSSRYCLYAWSPTAATSPSITGWCNGNLLRIDKVFDLADAATAHRSLEQGHTRGKLVLNVAEQI